MFLFIISFLLVFCASYFLTSVLAPKKSILGLIYIFLIAFAELVLTFEILSLFTAIKPFWVLLLNTLFLILSVSIWEKRSKPIWSLDYANFRNRLLNSFKLDKSLAFLYVAFCVFLLGTLFLCLVMPITNLDAQSYHVARCLFWVANGSLNHFEISDIRNLCLPINSEILYTWVILFFKKDMFLGFFSFVGYLLSMVSVYNILGLLGYCTRKRLWVIFILTSFASVIVQASSTETDIIVAGLVTSSIFLYWYALKNSKKTPIFMSSLAYALALGTKTTVWMAIPGVGLFLLGLSIYLKKKDFYKPLLAFIGFGLLNFIIFSSYNYILNYIDFSNFMTSDSFTQVSKNYYGIKAIPANFIKYIFLFFDFTGLRWSDYIGAHILNSRDALLNFLHLGYIHEGLYSKSVGINRTLLEPLMGTGVLGFLAFLPCLLCSLIQPVFKAKSHKIWFMFGFAILFVINLLSMSYLLVFMTFSVRFVMFFTVLSSPILVYSYFNKKNPLKYVIVIFAIFYLVFVSTHLWARPVPSVIKVLLKTHSISKLREAAVCANYNEPNYYINDTCIVARDIRQIFSKTDKILFFPNTTAHIYIIKLMEFEGYNIDFRNMENMDKIDTQKYNGVIAPSDGQKSTVVRDYEKRKDECEVTEKSIIVKKGTLVPCMYIANPGLPIPKDKHRLPPFEVQCFFTKPFMIQNHLYLRAIAGVVTPETPFNIYYYIYVNRKNPPASLK